MSNTELENLSPKDRFAPLKPDDLNIGKECVICHKFLEEGQRPTLVSVGPATPEDAQRCQEGRAYNALAVVVHQDCAWSDPEQEGGE